MEELNKYRRRKTAVVKLSEKKLKFIYPGVIVIINLHRGKISTIKTLHRGKLAKIRNFGYLIFIQRRKYLSKFCTCPLTMSASGRSR